MKKTDRISKIEIWNGYFYAYDEYGNSVKISRSQRTDLEKYDYSSISNHQSFQDDVQFNICHGKKLIGDQFKFIKEGKTIYENA